MIVFILINILALYIYSKVCAYSEYYKLSSVQYYLICFVLILIVTFRGPNVDHDYTNYLNEIYDPKTVGEPTFILFAYLIRIFSLPPVVVFFVYASLGIGLKFFAIRKFSDIQLIALLIYFSNFLLLHDINQIRAGVASGILLLSFHLLDEKYYWRYIRNIFIASFFHFSAIFALILLPLSSKNESKKGRLILFLFPILGLLFHLCHVDIISFIPIESVRIKMEMYKTLEEIGEEGFSQVNLFNPYYLFKLGIYYFFLLKYDYFEKIDRLFSLYLKIFAFSLFLFPALSSITPLLGYRIAELIGIVEILLFPMFFLIFKTKEQILFVVFCFYILLVFVNIYHKSLLFI